MSAEFPKKVFHGGKTYSSADAADILNVSASLNPFAPQIPTDFSFADLGEYPDDSYAELKEKISSIFHRPADEICVGNGSAELMRVYCLAADGTNCRIDMPTFGEYELSAQLAGKKVVSYPEKWDIRFICNPNNPTGTVLEHDEMLSIIDYSEKHNQQLFVDEAFMELAETDESVAGVSSENLFVLRSLTKAFAVPGLRFGFGFGPADLIEKMETIRPPWSVNSFAEKYAMAALDHYKDLQVSAKKITREREWIFDALESRHLPYFASKTNFVCINTGKSASEVTEKMLLQGIYVRDCTSFGLPENIRISVGRRDTNKHVLEVLDSCLR
ncbi:MAG TPA: histidinol-phosphate transaminase [Methanocorpusculum sp.]|nr:histidinol-phosphate transaminase [Methanocorpusculum sp.]